MSNLIVSRLFLVCLVIFIFSCTGTTTQTPITGDPTQPVVFSDPITTMEFVLVSDDVVREKNTGLYWQRIGDKQKRDWEAAKEYCRNIFLDGSSDWRLPKIGELKTLIYCSKGPADKKNVRYWRYCDYGYKSPTINQMAFPNTDSSQYWSSTTNGLYSNRAFYISFFNGFKSDYYKKSNYNVRCVRGERQDW